jgi:predicted AAA+ superfamily ATPase
MYNNYMVDYVRRPVGEALLRQRDVPVLLLEGARAVGKTTMMRQQIALEGNYSYVSLADRSTLEFATSDLPTWLRQLPRPAIIDEAQLLPGLPLAIKELVDELGTGNHFILTGSASIGRSGLGGADPLTRRSRRLTMQPLTAWEIGAQPGSLVDALFDGQPITQQISQPGSRTDGTANKTPLTDEALLGNMLIGGFPGYVYPAMETTRQQVGDRIRSDMSSVLGETILPDAKYDAVIARTALDALLRAPGGIFNASRLGQSLDLDRRTIDRYLSVFQRLFLIHWLPNLATSASRQSHARAKIHAVDTSFAVESLTRAGVDILAQRETFGAVLETYVVNQIVAAAEWAETQAQSYFWRQAGTQPAEVDLVLVDARERLIGIEVKASSEVGVRDLAGLRALHKDKGMHRGFIIYTGDTIKQLEPDIWALPVAALSDASAFAGSWMNTARAGLRAGSDIGVGPESGNLVTHTITPDIPTPTAFDATVLFSFLAQDDMTERGRILQFAHDLVDTYAFLYGGVLRLILDNTDALWAEPVGPTFFLATVTPRYRRDAQCRRDVLAFTSSTSSSATRTSVTKASAPTVLIPVNWVDTAQMDAVANTDPTADPVRLALQPTVLPDTGELRLIAPNTAEYRIALERLAAQLNASLK